MKRKELTQEYIMDYWLKHHGITVQWLVENEPELIKTVDWYKKYPVTKEQHDEWYEWAISEIMKAYRLSKKAAVRSFAFAYLNASPNISDNA